MPIINTQKVPWVVQVSRHPREQRRGRDSRPHGPQVCGLEPHVGHLAQQGAHECVQDPRDASRPQGATPLLASQTHTPPAEPAHAPCQPNLPRAATPLVCVRRAAVVKPLRVALALSVREPNVDALRTSAKTVPAFCHHTIVKNAQELRWTLHTRVTCMQGVLQPSSLRITCACACV